MKMIAQKTIILQSSFNIYTKVYIATLCKDLINIKRLHYRQYKHFDQLVNRLLLKSQQKQQQKYKPYHCIAVAKQTNTSLETKKSRANTTETTLNCMVSKFGDISRACSTTDTKKSNFNICKRSYSRYSASKIMPHNTFNLNNYDIIGFDLDGTLLRYNLDAMVPMEYMMLAQYLVENKNYPKELLDPIDKDIDFLQKGLILDAIHGNILKLTSDGVIAKATHGTKPLSEQDIIRIYGAEKRWDLAMQYMSDPLSAWNGPNADKLRALLDFFDMPAALLMARAVDLINEQHKQNHLPEYKVWPDILEALTHIYKREHFAAGVSNYFEDLKTNTGKYVHRSDPYIIEWLKELKKTKAIFLLTGSNIDFANLTASYALGHNWRDLFDIVIAFAKKPGFFTMQRPFFTFQGGQEDEQMADESIRMGNVYAQGHWKAIETLLAKKFKHKTINKPRSLYFGDNLIQDVYTPSKYCNLDTVSLVEELEEHECQDGYAFKKVIQSHFWDSYFSVDNKPTFWSEIIALHSKMCLPTIEHLCKHPINFEYERANSLKELCASKIED